MKFMIKYFNTSVFNIDESFLKYSKIWVIFHEDVIYTIIEKYDEWIEKKKSELERERRQEYIHPGMIKFLPEYVFRVSHPAVIGIRVLSGRIKAGMKLMKEDGRAIGSIKGIQSENKSIEEKVIDTIKESSTFRMLCKSLNGEEFDTNRLGVRLSYIPPPTEDQIERVLGDITREIDSGLDDDESRKKVDEEMKQKELVIDKLHKEVYSDD